MRVKSACPARWLSMVTETSSLGPGILRSATACRNPASSPIRSLAVVTPFSRVVRKRSRTFRVR